MENKISHTGIVTAIESHRVSVEMNVISACATCEGHNDCQFSESTNKTVHITTSHWKEYSIGEKVIVHISNRQSISAIIVAYLLPAILILTVVIGLSIAHINEMLIALIAILSIGIYVLILYCFRNKIQRKFTFTLSH